MLVVESVIYISKVYRGVCQEETKREVVLFVLFLVVFRLKCSAAVLFVVDCK